MNLSTQETVDSVGEVMLLTFHQLPFNKYRPVVVVGPANQPESSIELFRGAWTESLNRAKKLGMKAYFRLYEERYGFRHPEDPARPKKSDPLPYSVITMKGGNALAVSHTFDPDVVH